VIDREGLFRVSGTQNDVLQLRLNYERGLLNFFFF
jgi:hypothetical protein